MNIFATTRVLWNTFSRYRVHIAVLAVLGFLSAIVEGIGINAIIPLASFLTSGGTPTDFISRAIEALFLFAHIPFKFRYLVAFILALFMVRALSMVLFGYVRGWIIADFYYNESRAMLRRVLFSSWPYLLKQKLGHIHSTMVRDLQMTSTLLGTLGQIIQSFSGFLMYLLVAINISPLVTMSAALGGAILLFVVRPLTRRVQRFGTMMSSAEKNISSFLTEHVIGMKAVKAAGAEDRALASGRKLMDGLRSIQVRSAFAQSLGTSLFQPFGVIFVLALFAVMYKLPGFNFISFAAAIYLVQKIFTYLESGQSALNSTASLVPYANSMTSFKYALAEHAQREGEGSRPFSFERDIAFDGVTFAYAGNTRPVLDGVSFSVKKGETIGIIGPSGAGKTSIVDILLRLLHPSSGTITVDGVPLESVALSDWRAHIGYVAQDLFMFNGSIEENIRFYRPELSKEDVITAAKQANIYDFVASLPDGFASHVGDRGATLSGGQRQRVALARALAGKPDILILDEATSALDSESERLVQEALQGLRSRVTVFVIAHRLSTVANADKLVVLDRGRIVERGTPEELRADSTSYFSTHGGKI